MVKIININRTVAAICNKLTVSAQICIFLHKLSKYPVHLSNMLLCSAV